MIDNFAKKKLFCTMLSISFFWQSWFFPRKVVGFVCPMFMELILTTLFVFDFLQV